MSTFRYLNKIKLRQLLNVVSEGHELVEKWLMKGTHFNETIVQIGSNLFK